MSQEQVSENIDPELNEEEDIRMDEIRDDHWRDVSKEGDNMKKIHALRWDVYIKEKQELTKREFLVSIPYLKGGGVVWTCMKYNIIGENQQYESIGLCGFDYKLFEEEEDGVLERYQTDILILII